MTKEGRDRGQPGELRDLADAGSKSLMLCQPAGAFGPRISRLLPCGSEVRNQASPCGLLGSFCSPGGEACLCFAGPALRLLTAASPAASMTD